MLWVRSSRLHSSNGRTPKPILAEISGCKELPPILGVPRFVFCQATRGVRWRVIRRNCVFLFLFFSGRSRMMIRKSSRHGACWSVKELHHIGGRWSWESSTRWIKEIAGTKGNSAICFTRSLRVQVYALCRHDPENTLLEAFEGKDTTHLKASLRLLAFLNMVDPFS